MTDLHLFISIGTGVVLFFSAAYIVVSVISHKKIIESQRATIAEIRKSEQRYRALFENSVVGMLKFNSDTWKILDANQSIYTIFNAQSMEQIHELLQEIPPKTKAEIASSLKQSGQFNNKEVILSNSNGQFRSFLFSGKYDETKKTVHAILADITDKKRLEEAYIRAHRMEAISLLTGSLTHDLQNILAPVQISMRLLAKQVKSKRGKRILRATKATTEHGIRLVNNIMSLGRGVKGKYTPIHLNAFLKHAVDLLEPSKLHTVTLQTEKVDYVIDGDEDQLKQVLFNLIQNARDAMTRKGSIIVTVSDSKPLSGAHKFGSSRSNQNYVTVSVSDSGKGIPPNQIEKIFEPFQTTKKDAGGTGLGLSVVLEIIKKHDGFITVESKVKTGSTFNIYLPLKNQVKHETGNKK